jgi:DNA-directed RNA polymerase subunit alpha
MISGIRSPISTTVQFEDEIDEFVPQLEVVETVETYGKFQIAGLQRGWGTTLGNGLRRVLLGAMPGTAITSARIVGQQHEYGSVPHMREGIGEFLINAKGIRIRARAETTQKVLTLYASGEGEVVAGDIKPHSVFEIVNPEHHLATLDSDEGELVVTFGVEKGEGYQAFDHEDTPGHGILPVDAIFTPILKANYEVEVMSGRLSGRDLLTIEIWTDRTIEPIDALRTAADIFKDKLDIVTVKPESEHHTDSDAMSGLLETEIKDLEGQLRARIINALTRYPIRTLGELMRFNPETLKQEVRNFGEVSFQELHDFMVKKELWPPEDEEQGQ